MHCWAPGGPSPLRMCAHRRGFHALFSRSPSSRASAREGVGRAPLSGFPGANRPGTGTLPRYTRPLPVVGTGKPKAERPSP